MWYFDYVDLLRLLHLQKVVFPTVGESFQLEKYVEMFRPCMTMSKSVDLDQKKRQLVAQLVDRFELFVRSKLMMQLELKATDWKTSFQLSAWQLLLKLL